LSADTTTFFIGFTIIFGALGLYLWRLDRAGKKLEERIEELEKQKK